MQTTKEMRDRIRELATPERDDFDRAVNMLLSDFEQQQLFDLGDGRVVQFNPAGRFHGWVFRRHADGQLVSDQQLEPVEMPRSPICQ